jgi:predicted Rossmann fold flavoprotein
MTDVLIIGAGPAGLAAGIAWAKTNRSVCILERNSNAGKKLLLSGSGQCNVTHRGTAEEFLQHYGSSAKGNFVKPCYLAFDNAALKQFFAERGVPLLEREDGKVFPKSLNAEDLLNVLLKEFKKSGGTLQTETLVRHVRKTPDGFEAETDGGRFRSQKLVIAAGGQSYPATGSQGDGFRFAAALGHRIVPPKPALSPVMVQNYPFGNCAGISLSGVPVHLFRSGSPVKKSCGDVLFTHRGLSGPVILDMSRSIEPGDILSVQMASPDKLPETLFTGRKTLKNVLLCSGLPEKLLLQLLDILRIPPELPAAETNREIRRKIIQHLTAFPFTAVRTGDWNQAMATSGGVALGEVHRQTMASRLVSGLYFCGEVLDVDGGTGGYNIHFALSSGMIHRSR